MFGGKPRPDGAVAGLADAVKALRAELNAAMVAEEDDRLRFRLDTVTMEFAVEATVDAEASGGVKFWVVELGGKGTIGHNATHTITLTLTPKTVGGDSPLIADDE